jgi:hypothetical protein
MKTCAWCGNEYRPTDLFDRWCSEECEKECQDFEPILEAWNDRNHN